jgi:hypothetical protein
VAFDEPMPTPDGNTVDTMPLWEAYWVGGLGGAAGVMAGKLGELAPSINSGARTVSTATGAAFVRGFYIENPATTYTASVPAASAADRVDRLVLRLDRTQSTAANWLKPMIIQGTSGSATPPAIQSSTTGSWDLPIARWTTKADGTLTGLVDERYLDGGQFLVFKSTARPVASPPRQGLETDTGKPVYADGAAWNYYDTDTGWVTLTLSNSSWLVSSPLTCVARLRNGVATLRIAVKRASSTFAKADADGSALCTLPSQFRPGINQYGTVVFSGGIGSARVDVDSSTGVVSLQHNTADVAVGRTATFSMSYPVG